MSFIHKATNRTGFVALCIIYYVKKEVFLKKRRTITIEKKYFTIRFSKKKHLEIRSKTRIQHWIKAFRLKHQI